jgi:hypothetical protein
VPARQASATLITLLALATGTGGCATVYEPTTPRQAEAPGVRADIAMIRGPAREAVVVIRAAERQRLFVAQLANPGAPPCESLNELAVRARDPAVPPIDPLFTHPGASDVFVVTLPTAISALARPGLSLDLAVGDAVGDKEGWCLRLPLTAAGTDVLWRRSQPGWSIGASVRFDAPLSSTARVGIGWTGEMRFLHPLGPLSAFGALTFGFAGCRGDCPPFDLAGDGEDFTLLGLFGRLGLEAGFERQVPLHGWTLSLVAGGSATLAHLSAADDFVGPREELLAGPFAALRLEVPRASIPGFSPVLVPLSRGPELFAAYEIASGRGPEPAGWRLGIGWAFQAPL